MSVYGRDASDAQLLAKTSRFLLYRDSGPTLTFTRRQQVEHEAYLTLMAARAGVRVSRVLAAGPAGPAKDALLVTRPPAGRLLSTLAPYVPPPEVTDGDARTTTPMTRDGAVASVGRAGSGDQVAGTSGRMHRGGRPRGPWERVRGHGRQPGHRGRGAGDRPGPDRCRLDDIFAQLLALRAAGIAHGSLSTETIVLTDDGTSGFVDLRAATDGGHRRPADRDLAAALAATALVAGPERATAAAARIVPAEAIVGRPAVPAAGRPRPDGVAHPAWSQGAAGRCAGAGCTRRPGWRSPS